jgi:UbiD family decarboxylase
MSADDASKLAMVDTERFRLRGFVDELEKRDEVDIVNEPVALADLAQRIDGNTRAVLFRKAGPHQVELIANVMGSRKRIALAFGLEGLDVAQEIGRRLRAPKRVVEVASAQAPVQQIVLTGEEADFTQLPVHLQHALDGGPYISASIDYVIDPDTGLTNVGSRRLMLRGRREAGIDLVAPSDLQAIYRKASAKGQRLPVSFTVGSHPIDFMAAAMRLPGDELALVGTLRGEPVPVVRCVTNDIRLPADSEIVLEGYLDEKGWSEPEGPYGEFFGYYGEMKMNPVFHLTAITLRRDAIFQSVTIGGRYLGRTETAHIGTLRTELAAWRALESAVREPLGVYATAAGTGICTLRVRMRQRVPGEARNAISALFGSLANIKHVFVVDEDVDIHSEEQMDWALATRFQADRDLVVGTGYRALPLDPSLDGRRTWSKAGFDLTLPFGKQHEIKFTVPDAPRLSGPARFQTVCDALESGPLFFGQIMEAVGSRDGREIVCELDELRRSPGLDRLDDGRYVLRKPRP